MKELQPLISKIVELIEEGQGQLPDIAQEILGFYAWLYGFCLLVGTISFFSAIFVAKWCHKKSKEDRYEEGYTMGLFLSMAVATLSFVFTLLIALPDFLMTQVAPKLFILEYLKGVLQ